MPNTTKQSDIAVNVSHLSKVFKLPHEKQSSLKGTLISRFRGVRQSFEQQQALSDVSFTVNKGDFFAIVGRNGSGKSTLLKLLAGIYQPTEGSIETNGKLVPFIELGVGFNQELSRRENVFLNGALLGFNRKEMALMYEDIVKFAELERFMDQKLKNYSSGMQVRLAFSIAIRAKGDILLLDEVLAVGDAAFQQKCYNYFEELKQQKKTVVFVSHDMDAIRRFCNKAVYIQKGVLTHQGTSSEIADIYLEQNMESSPPAADDGLPKQASGYSLSVKLLTQRANNIAIQFTYKSKDKNEKLYLGLSIVKDGISIGELNTMANTPLVSSGKITYNLDTTPLNGGIYSIGAGLFRLRNEELVAFTKERTQFIVKGSDPTRGAALKLADAWEV